MNGRDCFLKYLLQPLSATIPLPPRHPLMAAYFLADTQPGHDVADFLAHWLPLLLRQMQRTTRRERITLQGEVHGRIDWPSTTKARYQNDVNPTLFVCRPPQRQDDTPENQLVKFWLVALEGLLPTLPPELQTAERWSADGVSAPDWLPRRLGQIGHDVRQALAHVRLRYVATPPHITPHHLMKARTSKTELYGRVANLYETYLRLVVQQDTLAWRATLSQAVLLPTPDTEFGDTCIRLTAQQFRPPAQPLI